VDCNRVGKAAEAISKATDAATKMRRSIRLWGAAPGEGSLRKNRFRLCEEGPSPDFARCNSEQPSPTSGIESDKG